ncbi:N-6 DNA methylase [Pseudohalioglobus lutimaris]|uniref:site-specific DNA-methyltransferase (adenine-specific) n=1 Tax=Pseudohalioglobus lutimaris TaxID=1737061 RepID=A0A2N5X130_9GAMM|nr:N-6 DNA methylase [Pseudohalioglobus lutimaris]PLW68160.1 SAM-dependent methyltransferase [Pseudohalioglobus lutimaris]
MSTTTDIVAKLWNLCNVLKDDGVTYTDYVKELTYLLFLKMSQETGTEDRIPEAYRWEQLEAKAAPDRLTFYRKLLLDLGDAEKTPSILTRSIYANANTIIKKPATLTTLVTEIDKLDWYSAKEEGLGDLYEGLLEKNANEKKSGAGQYFTPRVLIDVMVQLMQPQLGEVIQDPAAGTGGFLIAANHYLEEHNDLNKLDEKQWEQYQHHTFYGMEFVQDTHKLALMNLALHDIESDGDSYGIIYGDTMSAEAKKLPSADLILSNPPFGQKKGGGLPSRDDFTFPTSNKQLAFLQHIYRGIKPGGRAAVVLPDNVLFEANTGAAIRRDLMDKCNLHTILRLPTGIFYAQGVKTNVLFFSKPENVAQDTGNTREVWIYDMRSNMPSFGKRTAFTKDYFEDFINCFGTDKNGGSKREELADDADSQSRWKLFSREAIAERGDSLDISWIKDKDVVDAADLPEPEQLAGEAMSELTEALRELSELMDALGAEDEAVAQKNVLAEALGMVEA